MTIEKQYEIRVRTENSGHKALIMAMMLDLDSGIRLNGITEEPELSGNNVAVEILRQAVECGEADLLHSFNSAHTCESHPTFAEHIRQMIEAQHDTWTPTSPPFMCEWARKYDPDRAAGD